MIRPSYLNSSLTSISCFFSEYVLDQYLSSLCHPLQLTSNGIRTAAVKYEATFKTNRTTQTLTQTGKSLWLFVASDKLAQ
jgi:hypothetical protein